MQAYETSLLTTDEELAALGCEWTDLYGASATPNPFAHPIWLTTWARWFVKPGRLYAVVVRDRRGALVGVAPFCRQPYRLAPGQTVTRLQLLGDGPNAGLTEMPSVLIRPGLERDVLRAIVRELGARAADWDWIDIWLSPEHGWFEPNWLPTDGPGAGSFKIHRAAKAFVLLALPGSWDELRSSLKRNVKESLRRGANRLANAGHRWEIWQPDDAAEMATGLRTLLALHRARARAQDRVAHEDYVTSPAEEMFLHEVALPMFRAGHLTPCLLHVDGAPAAGRLLLHANGVTFLSISGFDPAWWEYSVATTVMAGALRQAIARGDRSANLSSGPDVAKLRWSETLQLRQHFTIVGPRLRSRLVFRPFLLLSNLRDLRLQEQRRDQPGGRSEGAREEVGDEPAALALSPRLGTDGGGPMA